MKIAYAVAALVAACLTATPARHTTEIFGRPVFTYSYREAVADDWLIDHEPPVRYHTLLSQHGIHFDSGQQVEAINLGTGEIETAIIFALPTVGPAIVGSMSVGDVYVTATFMLVLSATLIVGNIIADILLALLDPRIRLGGGAN